jgi:hypothetical protein
MDRLEESVKMLTIEGIYKDGHVVLSMIPNLSESKVLITFLGTKEISLAERGIDERQALELRSKLSSITDDWNQPEMDVYDVD